MSWKENQYGRDSIEDFLYESKKKSNITRLEKNATSTPYPGISTLAHE